MRSLIALLMMCLVTLPSQADMAEARQAYTEGRWQEAARLAQLAGGADGYAYAAGALLAQLMVEPGHPERPELARRAARLAEYAYRLDEEHPDARLRLAGALGYRGRFMNGMRAYVGRIPQRGRRLLESLVEENPNDPWAVGMLGAWHLEVARRGGDRGMSVLDASIDAGIGFYTNAIALDPHNPAPRYFFALALLALDDPAYYDVARQQLALCLQMPARDAFEAAVQADAAQLSELIGDRDAATLWADARMRY